MYAYYIFLCPCRCNKMSWDSSSCATLASFTRWCNKCAHTQTHTSWPPKPFCFRERDSDTIFSPKLCNIYEHREFSYACSINHPCGQVWLAVFFFFSLGHNSMIESKADPAAHQTKANPRQKSQGSLADSEVQTKHLNTPTLIWLLITVPPLQKTFRVREEDKAAVGQKSDRKRNWNPWTSDSVLE